MGALHVWRVVMAWAWISLSQWQGDKHVRNHWGHSCSAPHLRGSWCCATAWSHHSPRHLSKRLSSWFRSTSSRFINMLLPMPAAMQRCLKAEPEGDRPAPPGSCCLHALQNHASHWDDCSRNKLKKWSCKCDSWGSSSFSTLSRKAAVLSAQGHVDGRLCLFQSIFLHNPHTSQGTQHWDFDDYSFLLLFCGINCPQDLTNNIGFPPTLTKLDRKLKASELLSSSLCRWLTIWKGTSHTVFPVV